MPLPRLFLTTVWPIEASIHVNLALVKSEQAQDVFVSVPSYVYSCQWSFELQDALLEFTISV